MIFIDTKKLIKGLREIKEKTPSYADISNHKMHRKLLLMLESNRADYSAFTIANVEELLDLYLEATSSLEKETIVAKLEDNLDTAAGITKNIKQLKPRRNLNALFI